MDNISIARLLDETASLLEIDSADPFRIRSYRRAAEAVEQQTTQLSTLADDPKALLAIPGIGKGMAANIVFLLTTGTMPLREELLQKYKPTMLDLLRLPGMGPKTVALVWSACQVCDIDGLEAAAKAGHLTKLPAWAKSSSPSCSRESKTTAKTPAASASTRPSNTPTPSSISSEPSPASTRSSPQAPSAAAARP
ncbi:helix-hairpin-helix domain-containing protein [Tunturiibacter gelidiferens]|uniref:helix-hairpin-helix domain-containing protein n=1 Tax=Tunturiibacter gelidiferens TaxID=3069689 RepID=UPI003D9BBF7F